MANIGPVSNTQLFVLHFLGDDQKIKVTICCHSFGKFKMPPEFFRGWFSLQKNASSITLITQR